MVFSGVSFIFMFLTAVLLTYYICPKKLRNAVLLVYSLLFYFIGEQELVLIMIGSSLLDFCCSLGIERFPKIKGLFLGLSLAGNLGILGYFKYADLFIGSFNALTGAGVELLRIALPIGISFYTFQTMSYTIDVFRGNIKAERNLLNFAAYVTLFPQLVAGPIVRYEDVAAELKQRTVTVDDFAWGVQRFCMGLGKKVLIANTLAEFGNVYLQTADRTQLLVWVSAIVVPLQIYFDFAGYSEMAIGLGKMFGFNFPENFNYPMVAKSAGEFWRRWHMTLGGWFRDYVYFPLGGSRKGPARHILALFVVWFATGLWHGAEYNFIIWGLYYGLLIALERYVYGKFLSRHNWLGHIYNVVTTIFGFQIFSATSLKDVLVRWGELIGIGTTGWASTETLYYLRSYLVPILLALVLSVPVTRWAKKKICDTKHGEAVLTYVGYAFSIVLIVLSTAYLVDGSYNPFLYFRF